MKRSKFILLILFSILHSFAIHAQHRPQTIPWVDISGQRSRQVVVSPGTPELYNGHPTTVMLSDNRTIFATWTFNHGGTVGFLSVSRDAGLTWESLPVPKDWSTMRNCPSIYLLKDAKGVERLMVFAGDPKMSYTISEDYGKTWSAVKSLGFDCVMAFCSIVQLTNGDHLGMFHCRVKEKARHPLTLWQSISKDGGLTWNTPTIAGKKDGCSPCEPFVLRSPDGKQLICVARENTRTGHALMMFSNDEGVNWTQMRETSWALTGDRHIIKYAPDGRLVAVFRDMAPGSPTQGHFVAWVGTALDLVRGYSGQYKVKLLHSFAESDCGYPGLEVLPDGTFIATTYIKYRPGRDKQSIVSVRFRLEETDKLVGDLYR